MSQVLVYQLSVVLYLSLQGLGNLVAESREDVLHGLCLEEHVAPLDLVVEEGVGDLWKLLVQPAYHLDVYHLRELLPDLKLLHLLLLQEGLQVLALVVGEKAVVVERKLRRALL